MQGNNCNRPVPMPRCNDMGYNNKDFPLGMAYVPWQQFQEVYDVEKAINCGTIFPELYMPFCGKQVMRR